MASAVVAWSRAAVTATASTTAAQPTASDSASTAAAPNARRSVQKGMRQDKRAWGVPRRRRQGLLSSSSNSAIARGSLVWPSQKRAFFADRRTVMRAGDTDQGGDAFVVRALREGEDRALLHRHVHVVRVHQIAQAARRRLPRRLPQPEYRRTARFLRDSGVAGEAKQVGPHGDAVGAVRGKDRLPPDLAAGARCHLVQEAGG